MKKLLAIIFLISIFSCSERKENQYVVDDIIYGTKGVNYKNYYVKILPPDSIAGVLVLLHNFGSSPEKYLYEIQLDNISLQKNLLIIAPSPEGWNSHYLDSTSLDTLDKMIYEVSKQHNLQNVNFVIGGFSIGGTGALKYAEYIKEGNAKHTLNLVGAFIVDAPLDLERLWNSFQRTLKRNPKSGEASYFIKEMTKYLGGSPEKNINNYLKSSPFLMSDSTGGRVDLLKNMPIRFYTEPDIQWWKENRNSPDDRDHNYYDIRLIVKKLRTLDNKKIELIETKNKGYRKDGKRHPHSWSIVNEQELLEWILVNIKNL